ncbi:MAG: 1-deoxy-D-xylulose-5-phosphate reductoisomerase [Alphaproteobacteria bacterium]|nr:1-deoxy-D-xylulose-5-phosphate reductoisomerase [Alphaproteobacteria bacterium]
MAMGKKRINILGVTGSIGLSTVKIVLSAPELFDVHVISAHTQKDKLLTLQKQLGATHAICTHDEGGFDRLDDVLHEDVDITVSAITGFAGLRPLLTAIQFSKAVGIANKEPLVAAGPLVISACRAHGTKILPIDSEHNAIFQVFDEVQRSAIERVILTASGGPFREWSLEQMRSATPAQAVAHPNWSMGQKISVDSASMMNKALEVIEAHYLFDMPSDQIDVLVHPQSVVHSMVEYADGSVLSQMGASDMCTPIAYALGWPDRISTPGARLDLSKMSALTFEPLDDEKFPAVRLSKNCIDAGAVACIIMNAANEVAVDAFLKEQIGFLDIVQCVEHSLDAFDSQTKSIDKDARLEDIEALDMDIRRIASKYIETI